MPTRLLREGILSSERVEQLDWPAEVFYRRLMSKVDDHGLYDARPSMLRASLYPLRVDRVREADISRWMAACQKAGVIALYSAGGKPYLKMLDTRWQARSEAKYPLPTDENTCLQPETPVHLDVDVVEVVVGDVVKPLARGDKSPSLGAVNGEAVAHIPIVGGQEYGVSKALLRELETAYPAVDGPATLLEIRAWCVTNPMKRKTARGVPRFLNRWFEKVQNGV
jgi:hypothetical protein